MKITIVQGAFFPIPALLGGAVEKRWYGLAKEFVRQGHEVTYISRSFKGLPIKENEAGIRHIRVRGYSCPSSSIVLKFFDLFYTRRAIKEIDKNTDIIVSNTFWLPILLPTELQKKCMIDVARMPKGQMKLYTNNARLRANSTPAANAIKREIQEQYYDKVVIIPNTLPFTNEQEVVFLNKERIILYSGRVHPEKGIGILVKAFVSLGLEDWQLQIVGPYSVETGGGGNLYLRELKRIAKKSNVLFLEPEFDIEKLSKIYAKAAIFVYPSVAEQGETFGVSALEAMSWGCATVVSDLECFKDFVIDGKNGLCFNHRSAEKIELLKTHLQTLIDNPNLRNEIASAGLVVNKTHSIKALAIDFLNEFNAIIKNN